MLREIVTVSMREKVRGIERVWGKECKWECVFEKDRVCVGEWTRIYWEYEREDKMNRESLFEIEKVWEKEWEGVWERKKYDRKTVLESLFVWESLFETEWQVWEKEYEGKSKWEIVLEKESKCVSASEREIIWERMR